MSTPPITVTIAGDDAQLNAILAKALANVRAFGMEAGTTGEKMTHSFHEAKGAAALLGEEVGVKLNRHLRGILATSELIGPILQAAFPIIAALAFYEVVEKVGKKLGDWYYGAEALKQFEDKVKSTTELVIKLGEETSKLNKEAAEAGAGAQQKWGIALEEATEKAKRQKEQLNQLSDIIYSLKNGTRANVFGGAGDVLGNTVADIPSLKENQKRLTAELSKTIAEQAKAQAELNLAQSAGMDEYQKKLEHLLHTLDELKFKYRQLATKVEPSISTVGNHIDTFTDMLAMQGEPNQEIANKYLKHFQDLQAVFAATRTPAELLAISIHNLNELFKGDTTSETYKRALENIKDKYDEARMAAERFGQEVGHALAEGILMGRSWKNVLDSLIVAIAQLIIKMYVLKALQASSFGSSGFGGFITALVGGFAGKAGGGPVSGGMPYLVGEQGPEIFMPNTSGTIIPNGRAGGGGTTIYDFRGAVVTDDLLRRAEGIAMVQAGSRSAVAQAVGIVRENSLRGRN